MSQFTYKRLLAPSADELKLIAAWYEEEWKLDPAQSIEKISRLPEGTGQFQMMMYLNGEPIATGGIYTHVGLLDKVPRFKSFGHWLALVYTLSSQRNKGYGYKLCQQIQEEAKKEGLKEIYLFTHTAESLYQRLGWQLIERLQLGEKNIAVMKLELL